MSCIKTGIPETEGNWDIKKWWAQIQSWTNVSYCLLACVFMSY